MRSVSFSFPWHLVASGREDPSDGLQPLVQGAQMSREHMGYICTPAQGCRCTGRGLQAVQVSTGFEKLGGPPTRSSVTATCPHTSSLLSTREGTAAKFQGCWTLGFPPGERGGHTICRRLLGFTGLAPQPAKT